MHSVETDVIHSFWVPQFGQKQDVVPGITTRLVITPKRLGTYPVVCTELCGEGHAVMRTVAIVSTAKAFSAWVKAQEAKAVAASKALYEFWASQPFGIPDINVMMCAPSRP